MGEKINFSLSLGAFQSRPSREGFCKEGFERLREGYVECMSFNPVQAGKGSARRAEGGGRPAREAVSIPSKPGRVLQGPALRRPP